MSPTIYTNLETFRFPGKFLIPQNTMRTHLLFVFFLLFGFHCMSQELVGPARTLPGTLATFEIVPSHEASWHIVTPSLDVETYQVDTGSAKLYFACPVSGNYTVVAGIVVDGKSELLIKTFINGEEDTKPVPVPPVSSLETWIKTQTPNLVQSQNFASESKLVAECFEQIAHRIADENIKTAQNARTQLQIALTATLAKTSPTAITDWTRFLTELSRRLETELGDKVDDLAEVKQVIQNVGDALKSFTTLKTPLQNIDTPNNRGTQNRLFRNLLAN